MGRRQPTSTPTELDAGGIFWRSLEPFRGVGGGHWQSVTVIASSGGWIVAFAFLVIIAAVAFGLFSREGGEIDEHPIGADRGDSAPGAEGPSELEGQDTGAGSTFDQHGTR